MLGLLPLLLVPEETDPSTFSCTIGPFRCSVQEYSRGNAAWFVQIPGAENSVAYGDSPSTEEAMKGLQLWLSSLRGSIPRFLRFEVA